MKSVYFVRCVRCHHSALDLFHGVVGRFLDLEFEHLLLQTDGNEKLVVLHQTSLHCAFVVFHLVHDRGDENLVGKIDIHPRILLSLSWLILDLERWFNRDPGFVRDLVDQVDLTGSGQGHSSWYGRHSERRDGISVCYISDTVILPAVVDVLE